MGMAKAILSALAIVLTWFAFLPYARAIRRGEARPHFFSWVVWGVATVVVFVAQLAGNAGVGALPIGVSGGLSLYVAALAWLRSGDLAITRSDWGFLIGALSALPLWVATSDPLSAVVVLTAVDLAGFGPTLRKGWSHPHEEKIGFFALFAIRNLLVLLALEHYSATTTFFPAAVGLACVGLMVVLAWRRRVLGRSGGGLHGG